MTIGTKETIAIAIMAVASWHGLSMGATRDSGMTPTSQRAQSEKEQIVSTPTENNLPGNRMVTGRVKDIRGGQMEIDIGNPESLYVPLQPAKDKRQTFMVGDAIVITLNDHNAIVDYHRSNEPSHHKVIKGRLTTPLTVGLDKAVIETDLGTQSFMVAQRAKGKLTAIPVGAEALFMTDETGLLVDAQLTSTAAVRESAHNNKARIKGAHEQVRAVFQGMSGNDRIKISTEQGSEREVPFWPPLEKLDRLQPGQEVVLLMDDQGYVLEVASPDVAPSK
jgi:hypothetical protein